MASGRRSQVNTPQYYIDVPEHEIKDTESETLLVKYNVPDNVAEQNNQPGQVANPKGKKNAFTEKYRFALNTDNNNTISVKFDKVNTGSEASNANNDYFVPKKIAVGDTDYEIKPEASPGSTLAFSASSDKNKHASKGGAPNAISGGVISPKTSRARSRKVYRGKTKHSHKNTEARKSRRWTRLHKKKA
jgi:hypothetical protein